MGVDDDFLGVGDNVMGIGDGLLGILVIGGDLFGILALTEGLLCIVGIGEGLGKGKVFMSTFDQLIMTANEKSSNKTSRSNQFIYIILIRYLLCRYQNQVVFARNEINGKRSKVEIIESLVLLPANW